MLLVVALPNCQWANLKYPKFDGRDHVGIGAWHACSAMFESTQVYAPPLPVCSHSDLEECAKMENCNVFADFSEKPAANKHYEKSWVQCRTKCSLNVWGSHCLNMGCGGSQHTEQCKNVTEAVQQSFHVSYRDTSEPAWIAGDRCRDVSEICDIDAELGQAGGFGWCGFGFFALGQCLLIAYTTMHKKRDVLRVLVASLASFLVAWILLLVSWAIFVSALHSNATCTIIDASANGAIIATGNFGEIINGQGSYSFAFVIASWVLATLVVGVISHRVCNEFAKKRNAKSPAEE